MNDYEFYSDRFVTCDKCSNDKAFLWFDKKDQVHLISCDNCGVNERKMTMGAQAAENKQLFCCESFKDLLHQELHIDENPRVFEVMGKLFYYLENSSNPIVEQIRFCPFCGFKL
ncbi:MAG: hypothetical protein L0H53_15515 [Candidatus Nitrosocosmicus sp.]|nr:hypothetical protein [Candidatus Nitrosocosmicus sp.]MDN5868712.1 hypothetical protein [Candidatus Nitrosocosmicus sp.]